MIKMINWGVIAYTPTHGREVLGRWELWRDCDTKRYQYRILITFDTLHVLTNVRYREERKQATYAKKAALHWLQCRMYEGFKAQLGGIRS